ncbi:putative glycoprotein [Xinzhou dimarhabdovirus virus 1]|uniref:putative glycoprotein n=1 Tax=Xinzhou dimarhabdovirus virus 1 TaxID=1923768 RepID=UPI0009095FA3|nr:putative glycoprotein [Xinzhou dimarhabdovirus virus 1]APG78849.1 putative glycoprotein [Xinzhou dimarhabdovirus virus 1]
MLTLISTVLFLLSSKFVLGGLIIPLCRSGPLWHKINPTDMICPRYESGPPEGEMNMTDIQTFDIPAISGKQLGYLCHGVIYRVICIKGVFGGETINKVILPTKITPNECEVAVKEYLTTAEDHRSGYFPGKYCVYEILSTHTEFSDKKFILVSDHTVLYDPYADQWIDTLFLGGRCDTRSCRTIKDSVVWISNVVKPACPKAVSLLVHVAYEGKKPLTIHGPTIPTSKLEGACVTKFCGTKGLRLSSGFFIIPPASWIKVFKTDCTDGVSIRGITWESVVQDTVMYNEISVIRLHCLNTIATMSALGRASSVQLGIFQPWTPGIHPVYRVGVDNHLETKMCGYILGEGIDMNEDGAIGKDHLGHLVFWQDWVSPRKLSCEAYGPNGIYRDEKCQLHYPWIELRQDIMHRSILVQQTLQEAPHVTEQHYSQTELESDFQLFDKDFTDTKDIEMAIFSWTSSVRLGLAIGGVVLVIIVGLVLLVKLGLIAYIWDKCCRRKQHRQESIHLEPLNPIYS